MGPSVYVTNTNDFTHTDAYDGQTYVFPPNEPVLIPAAAATHMLGFNLKDKGEVLVRLGWAQQYDPETKRMVENREGVNTLAKFVFEPAVVTSASAIKRAREAEGQLTEIA